jgi:DNA polymerase-3 subunit delta'
MLYPEIHGQENAKTILTRCFVLQKLAPVWLFTGPAGVQKNAMARAFIKTLLCSTPKFSDSSETQYCGICSSCRLWTTESHPDFFHLKPSGKLRQIKREHTNDLLRFVSLKSYQGMGKAILIQEADRLHTSSANALLKTLEEPPPKTFFFLTCQRQNSLLPTLVSRCQILEFSPLSRKATLEFLKTQKQVPTDLAVRISGGRVEFLQENTFQELLSEREKVISIFKDWLERGSLALMDAASDIISYLETEKKRLKQEEEGTEEDSEAEGASWLKQKIDSFLHLFAEFFRDLYILQNRGPSESLIHVDQRPLLENLAQRIFQVDHRMKDLDDMRKRLQGNVNTKLTLEVLFLKLFT